MAQQREIFRPLIGTLGGAPVDLPGDDRFVLPGDGPFVERLMSADPPSLRGMDPHQRWQTRASCLGQPCEVFFPGDSGGDYVRARAICGACPVQVQCLDFALTPPIERHGFWGGATERERQKMRRRAA